MAAAFVCGELCDAPTAKVKDGAGVRGTVPQLLRVGEGVGDVRLMFRPDAVYRGATVFVRSGEREIARKKTMILAPGEMAELTLKAAAVASLGTDDITVSVEGGERQ